MLTAPKTTTDEEIPVVEIIPLVDFDFKAYFATKITREGGKDGSPFGRTRGQILAVILDIMVVGVKTNLVLH
jgi:hypothetical protein